MSSELELLHYWIFSSALVPGTFGRLAVVIHSGCSLAGFMQEKCPASSRVMGRTKQRIAWSILRQAQDR
jgi:hypothetical protein